MTTNSAPTSCVLCSATTLTHLEKKWDYDLYECGNCLMQFWWPFKNPGGEYYENSGRYQARNSHPTGKSLYESQTFFLRPTPKPGTTLLDLGMGSGRFLNAARKKGYRVTGTDFDANGVTAARTTFGLDDVYHSDIDTFFRDHPDKKFDIITIFNVLEHVDSFEFMKQLPHALNSRGIFVVDVPNRDVWKTHLEHEGPPLHLTRWNVASMEKFLNQFVMRIANVQKIYVPFHLVITRFNEWTKGVASFDVVRKMEQYTPHPGVVQRKRWLPKVLRVLALIKMYVLFFIPAVVLYAYLHLTGKACTEISVYAVKK